MNIDRAINLLVTITLIEMMIGSRLRVTFREVLAMAGSLQVVTLTGIASEFAGHHRPALG